MELCGVKRMMRRSSPPETSRVPFPNRGVARDGGGGWPCGGDNRKARWEMGCLTTFDFVQEVAPRQLIAHGKEAGVAAS